MNFTACVITLTLFGGICAKLDDFDHGHSRSTVDPGNPFGHKDTSPPSPPLSGYHYKTSDIKGNKFFKMTDVIETMLTVTWPGWSALPYHKNASFAKCLLDVKRIRNGLLSGEKWAIPFLDSSGKPGPSITEGWLDWIGNYDQCSDAVAPPGSGGKGSAGFRGKYCVLDFLKGEVVFGFVAEIGLCFPDTCSEQDFRAMADEMIKTHNLKATVTLAECRTGDTEVTAATVCCILALSCIGICIIIGTVYDVFFVRKLFSDEEQHFMENNTKPSELVSIDCHQSSSKNYKTLSHENINGVSKTEQESTQNPRTFFRVMLAFSVYSNGLKVLTVKETSESIGSLHGLRYLSIAWVIFGHTYYFGVESSLNDQAALAKYVDHWSYELSSNSFLAVDTFFVLSGLLASYLTLKEMDKKGWRINWAMFYFHRFWRLTPPYMLVLLTSLGLTQYFGGGALWANLQPRDKEYCEDGWWKNILYINNFYKPSEGCMYHSWYLANDMQFFIISPLMIVPFYFHYMAGIVSCLVFLLTSMITTGVLSTINDWTTTQISILLTYQERNDWEEDYYVKPWCRIGPFVIGIVAGYILYRIKGKSLEVKRWIVALGWLMSTAIALSAIFGIYGDTSGRHPISTGVAALYNSVARSAWGVSISWIILACDAGYGGPVNAILSWSPFVVLGRLTYMIYLLHPYIIYIYTDNLDMPFYSNDTTMSLYFIGFLTFSSFAALFFMLVFESPMISLEKVLLNKKPR